jgi:hypothetical protein
VPQTPTAAVLTQRQHCRRKEIGTRTARRAYMHARDTHHITHARIQTEGETWSSSKASTAKGRMPLLTELSQRQGQTAQSLVPAWQQPAVLATNQQCLQLHHLQPQAEPWSLAACRRTCCVTCRQEPAHAGWLASERVVGGPVTIRVDTPAVTTAAAAAAAPAPEPSAALCECCQGQLGCMVRCALLRPCCCMSQLNQRMQDAAAG